MHPPLIGPPPNVPPPPLVPQGVIPPSVSMTMPPQMPTSIPPMPMTALPPVATRPPLPTVSLESATVPKTVPDAELECEPPAPGTEEVEEEPMQIDPESEYDLHLFTFSPGDRINSGLFCDRA